MNGHKTGYYQMLAASISDDDIRKVARIIAGHVGEDNPISLREIAIMVFGKYTTSTERKTRMVLEQLVNEYKFPVGAYSGRPGRWLCKDAEELSRVIADLEARRSSTAERIRSLRVSKLPPVEPVIKPKPVQDALFDLPRKSYWD